MTNFTGFARPKSNFYRLPNDWFDLWRQAREVLAQGPQPARIVGPLKIVEYVIKYTWGRTNFDDPIRLSRSDLRKGVRGRNQKRLDRGTGLGSESTISRGINTALELGLLEQLEINHDPARQQRLYLPRLRPPEEDIPAQPPALGFDRPEANFFLVPHYWTDISAEIRSEILIIATEYFFRHTWGWQTGEREVRWLDADDVANGRKYRSAGRAGERYDQGTGYTTRKMRDALEEGVQRGLLVWRQGEMAKEYALRLVWMEYIGDDGYFDPYAGPNHSDSAAADQTVEGEDQTVGVSQDQIVEGTDQSVEARDRIVEGADQSVAIKDQSVEGRDQTVVETDQIVAETDQAVDRTCKDTFENTLHNTSKQNTNQTTTNKPAYVVNSKQEPLETGSHPPAPSPKNWERGSRGAAEGRRSGYQRLSGQEKPETPISPQHTLQELLMRAGVTGAGLHRLCCQEPPVDLQQVRAVILYAESRSLGPGYIYRHLESSAAIEPLFLQLAALDDGTLALFRQGLRELKMNGTPTAPLQTSIPRALVPLFARFAQAFAGLDPAVVTAALNQAGSEPEEPAPTGLPENGAAPPVTALATQADLDRFWSQVLEQLQFQMTQETFHTWVEDTRLVARQQGRFTIVAKSIFARDWLQHRLCSTIQRTVAYLAATDGVLEGDFELEFVVENET